jgi:hypothetical protein
MNTLAVQYRVVFGKKDEAVEGPDDAALVVTVAAADALGNPTSLYMQGKLKAAGPSGALFELLRSGEVSRVLARLASRP